MQTVTHLRRHRSYQNYFLDNEKQGFIDFFLGNQNVGGEEQEEVFVDWMEMQLRAREDEYLQTAPLSVFVGTWNVAGQPPGEDLLPFLSANGMGMCVCVCVGGCCQADSSRAQRCRTLRRMCM